MDITIKIRLFYKTISFLMLVVHKLNLLEEKMPVEGRATFGSWKISSKSLDYPTS